MEDIEVKRFAVKYDPPTLVVEYRTPNGSLFLKKIRIKVKAAMDAERLCDKIIEKNAALLGPERVCRTQLLDLLNLLLQESQNTHSLQEEDKAREVQQIERPSLLNCGKSGGAGASAGKSGDALGASTSALSSCSVRINSDEEKEVVTTKSVSSISPRDERVACLNSGVLEDLSEVDLNKYDDDSLSRVKSQMDVQFLSNRVTPGHPDFVWDKQETFSEGDEDCDWDDESESEGDS